MKIKKFLLKNASEISVILIGSFFGFITMFGTFLKNNNTIFIATKAWSDFASHIPLIRSFSLGSNFPPEYPLFPGEPIKYHFIFYSFVGFLEKLGVPIDLALNIPSFLGFVILVFMIYFLANKIFKSKAIGILSVLLFLFNSSLSYIYYFKNNPFSIQSILKIPSIVDFQSFAPYGQGLVTAFWNFNIYTNQRHLALSFAVSLIIIYFVIRPILQSKIQQTRVYILLGIILGFSFFLHTAVFIMTSFVVLGFAIVFPKIRKNSIIVLLIAAALAYPQYLYLSSSGGYSPHLVFGYLVSNNFTIQKFIDFWIWNLGLSIILIPLGFILANRQQKKIFLSFFILFIIGNSIQFSPEIAANHKFFNYFLLVANMFSAFVIVKLWNRKTIFRPFAALLFFFMILGGIIDFFPVYNDKKIALADYKMNKDSSWILQNTKPESVFLNTSFLYDPASLAGRKIFIGWPYFAWSQGYDTTKRGEIMREMLGAKNKTTACKLLNISNIDYVEIKIQNPPDPNIPLISNIYQTEFVRLYRNSYENYSIYDVVRSCR